MSDLCGTGKPPRQTTVALDTRLLDRVFGIDGADAFAEYIARHADDLPITVIEILEDVQRAWAPISREAVR